jgi:predicted nuclease of predicted toxin-antitoxin system
MKILVDENIPRMTVNYLRELGHDVKDIRSTAGQGIPDCDLWNLAMVEGRLLITTDKGFTEYRGAPHYGILIVRLRQPNRHKIHQAVMRAVAQFPGAQWPGLLVVVRDTTTSTSRTGSARGT